MTETVRVGLVGHGGVGRAFLRTARSCRDDILRRHGLSIDVAFVRRSSQQAELQGDDLDAARWVDAQSIGQAVSTYSLDTIVQAIPGDQARTPEARDQIVDALQAGADVVTATKSPLVAHWAELDRVAVTAGRCIRISAAAGAALPAVDLCRRGLRALPCESIRACLNGTTNFVLDEMRKGISLREAVDLAVEKGISEPNPQDDLSGRDAAMKIVLLANLLQGRPHAFADVEIEGIHEGIEAEIQAVKAEGRFLRSVAVAQLSEVRTISVGFERLEASDPLAGLVGVEKGVEFDCGPCGKIVVTGGRSSPEGAAFALLKDVVNIATGDRASGFG